MKKLPFVSGDLVKKRKSKWQYKTYLYEFKDGFRYETKKIDTTSLYIVLNVDSEAMWTWIYDPVDMKVYNADTVELHKIKQYKVRR